ncbi:hypothetical protein [Thalassovita taeanensis]|uniref:Uncharacterized protein n=1 Tax=Thalassovita taeanensis TaxID=657014 RepID=A0A1H9FAW4_9RHOB|nr:hypothetical protein [Thalassovita taeanensis]SEQ35039.1 hypothetical protein SAMN04488092_10615 [Thalassovita taeanensis]
MKHEKITPDSVNDAACVIDNDDTGQNDGPDLNDAYISGKATPAFDALLERPVTILIGQLYGARDRRNTPDEGWKQNTLTFGDFIKGYPAKGTAAAFGLSRHPEAKRKEGAAIVLGSSIGGARKATAMDTMYLMGLDVDSGAKLDDVLDVIETLGLACFAHTSFNHGKSGIELKRDDVLRKLKISTDPTLDQVKEYLRHHSKDRYDESFINSVSIRAAKKQVKAGVVIVLDTEPLDKFRLFFPLAEPIKIIDQGATHQGALDDWESAVTGLASEVLGVNFDTSCTDPSRLFYSARHPASAGDEWGSYIIQGEPLDYAAIPRVKKADYNAGRAGNAFMQAGGGVGQERPRVILDSGRDLTAWHSMTGKNRLMLADLLETNCPDKIRSAGGERSGHVHTECPFEHEHTNEGGTGTMAINCIDNENGYWTWFCKHDACQGRHKTELLAEAINRGWFDESALDGDDLLPLDDEAQAEADALAEAVALEMETGTTVAEIAADAATRWNADTTGKEIAEHFAKRIAAGTDESVLNKDKDVIVAATSFGKLDVNKIIRQERGKHSEREKAKVRDEASEKAARDLKAGIVPDACWTDKHDFSWQKNYAGMVIDAKNTEGSNPFVYTNGNVLARVSIDRKTGSAEIVDLSTEALVTFLSDHGNFMVEQGAEGDTRQIACPTQISVQLIHEWEKTRYPELEGIIPAPQFAEDGTLVLVPGYHKGSGLFYAPPTGFEVADVPDKPTPDDVNAAVDLWRNLYADFPFEGMTRNKIMAGDESADFAHLIGLALTTPARDLMGASAVTPAFLATKPAPGTGATLMLQILQMILFGSTMIDPPATNDDELHKTVFADLIAGKPMKVWDNVETVGGSVYPALLTAPAYSGRVLGLTLTKTVRNRMSVAFTGNNPEFTKELRRRVVLCRLDAKMEKPEERGPESFKHPNVLDHARDHRAKYYHALLVMIQNWIAQDYPQAAKKRTLASYENWSEDIGGILAAAGIHGFLGNRDKVQEYTSGGGDDDPLRDLVECWLAATMKGVDENPRVCREGMLCKTNQGSNGNIGLIDVAAVGELELPVKLSRHASDAFGYDSAAFGRFVGKGIGRVFEIDGKKWAIEKGAKTKQGVPWSLVAVTA